jgi:6,7-dimethyl-8-ribityllumazine synthase
MSGSLQGEGLRIAIVVSRFNELATARLLEAAHRTLLGHGVRNSDILVAWVPGSFELPLVARRLASGGAHDAVICLGAVIKGETAHFEHIAGEAARGIALAAQETGVPIIFGVLTTYTLEQALDRAGGKMGNVGTTAALSAIQMANLMRVLSSGEKSPDEGH